MYIKESYRLGCQKKKKIPNYENKLLVFHHDSKIYTVRHVRLLFSERMSRNVLLKIFERNVSSAPFRRIYYFLVNFELGEDNKIAFVF